MTCRLFSCWCPRGAVKFVAMVDLAVGILGLMLASFMLLCLDQSDVRKVACEYRSKSTGEGMAPQDHNLIEQKYRATTLGVLLISIVTLMVSAIICAAVSKANLCLGRLACLSNTLVIVSSVFIAIVLVTHHQVEEVMVWPLLLYALIQVILLIEIFGYMNHDLSIGVLEIDFWSLVPKIGGRYNDIGGRYNDIEILKEENV